MKVFSDPFKAALAAGSVRTGGAVQILATSAFGAWSGVGSLVIGSDTFVGIGDHGVVTVSGNQMGATQQRIDLTLSGVEPTVLDMDTTSGAINARSTVWRLAFDNSGEVLLDAQVFDRGRLDQLGWTDTPGGSSVLKATIETAARGLGRQTGRLTADADQRMISATDASLSRVTQAGSLTLAWGGKPPSRAGDAIPGALQNALWSRLDGFFGRQQDS